MNRRVVRHLGRFWSTVWSVGLVFCAGCQLMVNPFTDELSGQPPVTTASAIAVRAAKGQASSFQRPFAQTRVDAKDGTVTHGPLLFEDGAEEVEAADVTFAWTGDDYLEWFMGGGRFLINTVVCPISAIVTPPWNAMASDGVPAQRVLGLEVHDCARHTASARPGALPARSTGASG